MTTSVCTSASNAAAPATQTLPYASFSSYMRARQPVLLRTARSLTGNPCDELPEPDPVPAGDDPAEQQALRDAMWRAVMRLPARQRAMVVLRYYEDLSEAQTAEVLGVSVGTVKSAVSRALGKLREDAELGLVRKD